MSIKAMSQSGSPTLTNRHKQRYQSMHISPQLVIAREQPLSIYPFAEKLFGDAIAEAGV